MLTLTLVPDSSWDEKFIISVCSDTLSGKPPTTSRVVPINQTSSPMNTIRSIQLTATISCALFKFGNSKFFALLTKYQKFTFFVPWSGTDATSCWTNTPVRQISTLAWKCWVSSIPMWQYCLPSFIAVKRRRALCSSPSRNNSSLQIVRFCLVSFSTSQSLSDLTWAKANKRRKMHRKIMCFKKHMIANKPVL